VIADTWLSRIWRDRETGRWCKARIWKDRETGRWCFDVRAAGLRSTGDRAARDEALEEVLDEFAWIRDHEHAWPAS
jgi:hypothetical protein